ncbi:hypothetical protein AKN87_03415 [Thiopseudomonas alkaliphila]|nr:hypothetical protein AKN87_03415 [Thiopseudomonas alkaliphila]AKX54531.1 hypothetical protein AKN90_01485 [Thiopseudomonas alkaliphila]
MAFATLVEFCLLLLMYCLSTVSKSQVRMGFKNTVSTYFKTTQAFSSGGSLHESRPKGIAGLRIREWMCSEGGAAHDCDVNAGRNTLAVRHGYLEVQTL